MNEFKVGDVVQLKSGGPKMTVHSVKPQSIICKWFAGSKIEEGSFSKETVIMYEETEKKKPGA